MEGDGGIAPTPVITVTGPDNEPVELNGVRFTPEKAGTYTVTITATDSWGNSATETKTIVVTEEDGGTTEPGGDTTEPGDGTSDKEPLSAGAIAGIIVAAVVVLAGGVTAICFLVKKKRK